MNRNYCMHILAVLALFQASFDATAQSKPLKQYIERAQQKEENKDAYVSSTGSGLMQMSERLYHIPAGSAVLYALYGAGFSPYGLLANATLTSATMLWAGIELRNYVARAPTGFRESLEKLDKLIDHKKSVIIGGKEYVLAKEFNKTDNTGYFAMNTQQPLSKETINFMADNFTAGSKHQYEIYLMPNHKNLVPVFDAITQALREEKNNIAFIAIRPTPILTNAQKQILPRIVIVLKENTNLEHNKKIAEDTLRTVYRTLETSTDLAASGGWPRYSEQVKFASAALEKPFSNRKLNDSFVFVGVGNSDFKQRYPTQFERKKFLGITRHGDMAYPLNTPEQDKISTIIVGK